MNTRERKEFYDEIFYHVIMIQLSYEQFGLGSFMNFFTLRQEQLKYEISYYLEYSRHPTSREIKAWASPAIRKFCQQYFEWDARKVNPPTRQCLQPNTAFVNMIKSIYHKKHIGNPQRKRIGPCN